MNDERDLTDLERLLRSGRAAIARIIRRHHRAWRRQGGTVGILIVDGVEVGALPVAGARIDRVSAGRGQIRSTGGRLVDLLCLHRRSHCRARRRDSANRQNVSDHHRSCKFPKSTPDQVRQMAEDRGAFKTIRPAPGYFGNL